MKQQIYFGKVWEDFTFRIKFAVGFETEFCVLRQHNVQRNERA